MLRLQNGQCVGGARQHRLVWALVNGVLLEEASGRGYAVHRVLLRRKGARLQGDELMTRSGLLRMIEEEDKMREVARQLMTVGRDVRSTPMQWANEGKKLDTIVKYMSWCPPWVRGEDAGAIEYDLLGENLVVYDMVGRGRTPAFWWTLNCGWRSCNNVYDIHRLNVAAAFGEEAVTNTRDVHRAIRKAFVRDRRDIVAY